MTDLNRLIDRYVAIWNETDPERRRALIAETFTEDGVYLGPLLDGDGHAGIEAMASGIQEQLAGYRVRRTSEIDAHHDRARYTWEILRGVDAARFAAGTDVVVLAGDGRLRSVTAFIDQPPVGVAAHGPAPR